VWFGLAIGTALFWGVGQVLSKHGLRSTSPYFNNLVGAVLGAVVNVPIALIGGIQWHGAQRTLPLALLAAAGYLVYFYALERGPVSITGTVMACYPVATVVLSVLFLGERVGRFQAAGIALVLVASLLLSAPTHSAEPWRLAWIGWGALAAAILGTADFLNKVAIGQSNVYTLMLGLTLAQAPLLVLLALLDKNGRKLPNVRTRAFIPTGLGVLGLVAGGVTMNLAFASGPASLVSPISASYVGVSALLAVLFLGERLVLRQVGGIVLAAAGVALVGVA
jgi:bacterial/archaeal transporter family protein